MILYLFDILSHIQVKIENIRKLYLFDILNYIQIKLERYREMLSI